MPNQAIRLQRSAPVTVDVFTPEAPGDKPTLVVTFFSNPLGPDRFCFGDTMELDADLAVRLGEHLVEQGIKARSGLVVASKLPAT